MPMIVRTGVDLVYIPRFARVLARYEARFLARIYTNNEIAVCGGRVPALAARWAAKEAVAKLLGVGVSGLGSSTQAVSFLHIEIIKSPLGKPLVVLHARARQHAQIQHLTSFDISMSHDGDYAMAYAVAIGAPDA